MAKLWAIKPMSALMNEAREEGEHQLKRALGPVNLITLGIGAVIGAGIFVLTGQAAARYAGPAVALSFILAGITCAFAAATVASGWSGYFVSLMQDMHLLQSANAAKFTTTYGNVLYFYNSHWLPLMSLPEGVSAAGLPHV